MSRSLEVVSSEVRIRPYLGCGMLLACWQVARKIGGWRLAGGGGIYLAGWGTLIPTLIDCWDVIANPLGSYYSYLT